MELEGLNEKSNYIIKSNNNAYILNIDPNI